MTPRKVYLGPITDSRRWDRVDLRPDDVIVVTPPKCGTTWMQTIIALLLSGDPSVETDLSVKMPWVDVRFREIADVAPALAAMTGRRCMKSHTPMDGLPIHPDAHYICVFRHPLDAHFSFRDHVRNLPITWFDHWYPEDDPDRITFRRFLDGGAEGYDGDLLPLAHILRHYQTAKAMADQPNVTLFHFADMTRDLATTFARVADLLGVSHSDEVMAQLQAAATFDHMKQNADRYVPSNGFHSGAAFFRSGDCGKWHGHLTQTELAAYDAVMQSELSPEDRHWLEHGSGAA